MTKLNVITLSSVVPVSDTKLITITCVRVVQVPVCATPEMPLIRSVGDVENISIPIQIQ